MNKTGKKINKEEEKEVLVESLDEV